MIRTFDVIGDVVYVGLCYPIRFNFMIPLLETHFSLVVIGFHL